MEKIKFFIFLFILAVFTYLRLTPLFDQAVPYTYDQGRDFLKVEEIIRSHNLTFIGPTTGIMGVFHGAWWYYLASIPYLLSNGNPLGFYYFMFFLSLAFNLGFTYFFYREFGSLTALVFFGLVAVSPYFQSLSIFASNNIITPYMVGGFLISVYYLLKSGKKYWLLFAALFMGFVMEFELSFGLFIFPSFLLVSLLFKKIRKNLFSFSGIGLFLTGALIPLAPRLLFEVKNSFIQTKTLIGYFFTSKINNPKPMVIVLSDRSQMFFNYLKDIFYQRNTFLALIFLSGLFYFLFRPNKKEKKPHFVVFIVVISIVLFLMSLAYRDNFWTNYYEGIQYIFLFALMISMSGLIKNLKTKIVKTVLVLFVIAIGLSASLKNYQSSGKSEMTGLKITESIVKHLYKQVADKKFCVRIYTPPVIPYTYDYLFSYYSRNKNYKKPVSDFVDNKCYFIIENDVYQFRIDEWRKNNIPKEATLDSSKKIARDVVIEAWKIK